MTDTLRCRCGTEVRIVRLNPATLALGHVRNPRNRHHPVRLSRSATSSLGQGDGSLSEVPESLTPKDRTARGPRSDGLIPTASPRDLRSPARAGRVTAGTPRLAAPRSARAG